jgi:hypothetical protein
MSAAADVSTPKPLAEMLATELMTNGLGGLVSALAECPEALQSAKRTKMIHKKGELLVVEDESNVLLKWNADFKAGALASIRVVTVKKPGEAAGEESATDGEGVVESAAGDAAAGAPVAGQKRPRAKAPLQPSAAKRHLLVAIEWFTSQGKTEEADQLQKLIEAL